MTTTTGPSSTKCQIAVQPVSAVQASGGTTMLQVSAQPECAWKAGSDISWIAELTPQSGQGSAQVQVRVAANPEPTPRQGAIQIGGTTVSIRQDAASCNYDVTPGTRAIGNAGGTTTVALTAAGACGWSAAANASWLSIASAPTGSGNATITIRVEPNAGIARVGAVTIAGQVITINQDAGNAAALNCTYTAAPSALSVGADGGPGTVAITAAGGCSWAATSSVPWLVVTSGVSGDGNGTVGVTIATNAGGARSGTISVAGQTVNVSQAAAAVPSPPSAQTCTYSLGSTSQSIGSGGGSGTVTVTAPAGCAWSATSGATWLTISSGASSAGNGGVTFTAVANSGSQRTGFLTIASQTFAVTQAGAPSSPPACSYSLSGTSQTVPAAAGNGTPITVTTTSQCAWTAASNTSWITVSGGTAGTGSVAVTVSANTGAQRTGTLTVAGQTYTVTQSTGTPPCSYTINPTQQQIPKGGSGRSNSNISVSTQPTCSWTAASNASWITVTGGTPDTGNGTVTYSVAANSGPERSGTIIIADQTFTANQDSGCVYDAGPGNIDIGDNAGTASITVATAGGCTWSATTTASWITISNGTNRSGNGAFAYTVTANPGKKRSGKITVATETITIDQEGH